MPALLNRLPFRADNLLQPGWLLWIGLIQCAEQLPGLGFELAYQGEVTLGVPVSHGGVPFAHRCDVFEGRGDPSVPADATAANAGQYLPPMGI